MFRQIDVIIPTNKKLHLLKNLIYQLNYQKGNFNINIIIIHQSSRLEIIPSFLNKNNIKIKRLFLQNLSNAKNEGLNLSSSDIVTFIDDDIILNRNYLLEGWTQIKKKKIDMLFFRINKLNSNIPLTVNMKEYDHKVSFSNSSGCLSSAMWVKKSKNKIIKFDKKFGLGAKFGSADETELIYRCLSLDKKIYYVADKLIFHPSEFVELKKQKDIYKKFLSYGIGQGALFKKYYKKNGIYFYYLYLVSILKSIIGILINIPILKKNNLVKYFAMLRGKIKGYKIYK